MPHSMRIDESWKFNDKSFLSHELTQKDIDLSEELFNVSLLVISFFIAFFGYRFFKLSVVFQGAIFSGYLGFFIAKALTGSSSASTREIMKICFTMAFGFVGGACSWFCRATMLFVLGLVVGIQIGTIVNALLLQLNISGSNAGISSYLVMAIFALAFGMISTCVNRPWHISMTALVGSYWSVQAIGFFAKIHTFVPFEEIRSENNPKYTEIIAIYIGFSALSMITQFNLTAKNVILTDDDDYDDDDDDEAQYTKLQG